MKRLKGSRGKNWIANLRKHHYTLVSGVLLTFNFHYFFQSRNSPAFSFIKQFIFTVLYLINLFNIILTLYVLYANILESAELFGLI